MRLLEAFAFLCRRAQCQKMLSILPDSRKGVFKCNHEDIRRPTKCRGCGEFICNKCHGEGAPGGCKTEHSPQKGATIFGCGRRVSNQKCPTGAFCSNRKCRECDHGNPRYRYAYRPEHPNLSGGATPCEACICGIWSRNTCPRCHGEGQIDGLCCCGMLISERFCPERCKRHIVPIASCDKCFQHSAENSTCTRCRASGVLYVYGKEHESHEKGGFCRICFLTAVDGWRDSLKKIHSRGSGSEI